jgi:O-antigen/teichoic acid export membrane protein
MGTQLQELRYLHRAASLIQRVWQRFTADDAQFVTSSTVLTVGIALARILGFGFSMILTRKLTQADFGFVQYCIILAGIVAVATQPFSQHVLARFISQYKGDQAQLARFLNTAGVLVLALVGFTLLIAIPLLGAMERLNIGVLTVFIGSTAFYLYYGAARGFIASYRLLAAYLGSNLVQIIAIFLLYVVFDANTPVPALLIYGLSYFLPLIVLQVFYPLPFNFRFALPSFAEVRDLARFSVPFWLSHMAYMLHAAIDVLLLESFWGTATVGAYALTKTLTMLFNFIAMGITTVLMPKIAGMPRQQHRAMLVNALVLALAANGVTLLIFMATYAWFVGSFFGMNYVLDGGIVLIMALAEIIFVVHGVITAAIVGGYNPRLETLSRGIALACALGLGLVLVPAYGIAGAALTQFFSAIIAVGIYGVAALIRQKRPAPLAEQRS